MRHSDQPSSSYLVPDSYLFPLSLQYLFLAHSYNFDEDRGIIIQNFTRLRHVVEAGLLPNLSHLIAPYADVRWCRNQFISYFEEWELADAKWWEWEKQWTIDYDSHELHI
jgi:hypothetical protein